MLGLISGTKPPYPLLFSRDEDFICLLDPGDGRVGGFRCLAIVNNAAVSVAVQDICWNWSFVKYIDPWILVIVGHR